MDAQRLGGEAKSAYDTVARRGMEPIAIRGAIQVGNGYANAYTESGKVFFRVDAVDSRGNAISPEALVRHELFHNYISEEGLRASAEVIRESMTAEEYDSMYEAYRDAYASIYDFETMSVEEIERILREEIAADAYAGLNFFSEDAPVQEAVRAEAERNAPTQRAEVQRETTGPPENKKAPRFSLNVYSEQQKENWNRSKKIIVYENAEQLKNFVEKAKSDKNYVSKIYFGTVDGLLAEEIMNETGYDFQGKNVTLRADNVRKIFKDHGAESTEAPRGQRPITADDFGKIPEVIGNPDSISESDYFGRPAAEFKKTIDNSRITVFAVDSGGSSLDLYVQTMYAGRKKGSIADTANASALTQTPVAPAGTASFVEAESGSVQGATASGRLVEPTNSASTSSIRSNAGNSQEKSSGRASVEAENRGSNNEKASSDNEKASSDNEKREPRYTVIDGKDAAGKESALADAYDKAVEQGKGVEISEVDLKKYQDIRDNPEQTLIEAVKKYYEESLKGTSVEVTANDGIVEIRFENDGKKKSVGWRMKADKAATFEKLHQLTENAEYAYSEANRNENERTSIPMFHYFVNNARIAGRDIPVKIQVRDVITSANSKETHYYTHTLEKNMRGNSGPVAGTQSANIDSNATAPFETNIRSDTGKSQEKSSGKASVEVENRNTAMSEEDARRERLRKLQEADRKEFDRLTKRDDTLHQINRENGRPMPNKGSGEVYREHGEAPNEAMRAVWEYEHDKIMERDAEIRVKLGLYDGK